MTPTIVRTITLGVGAPHPLPAAALARAARFLRGAQAEMEQAGYTVQPTRIATLPVYPGGDPSRAGGRAGPT